MAAGVQTEQNAIDRLFVYGSLNNAYHLRLITGRNLTTETATLYDHRRIHPESGYPFALRWRGSKIEGRVVFGVTPDIFKKIDDYESEGELYLRELATVYQAGQPLEVYVYIGLPHALKPYFKKGLNKRERIAEYIEHNVGKYLEERVDQCRIASAQTLSLQVRKELLSEEIHSLVRQYFHDAGLPPFIIKHELEKASIPTLDWLRANPAAQQYADHYLTLAVKLMVFNQIEERLRHDFRAQVEVSDAYYMHTLSALMALKLLVSHQHHLRAAMSQTGTDRYDPPLSYLDYTVAAIFIADALYTPERAEQVVAWVRANQRPGMLPIGAELEFSDLGGRAINAQEGDDPRFDNFYYFYDFDLMRRGWKLGAHVDDHGFLTTTHTRTRGFLELAFGRYRLLGDVSKPATNDPWILARLIQLANQYIGVRPHSLHISLQTLPNAPFQKITDPDYLLCLLLLGGDLREDAHGTLREMRIYRREILRAGNDGVYISRFNRHHKSPDSTEWNSVVEYQFPRLSLDYDYQPLIMALKGFQMAENPYPLKDYPDCPCDPFHQEIETVLIRWAAAPTPLPAATLDRFLALVEQGLAWEIQAVGHQYANYAHQMLEKIAHQLNRRNTRIQHYHDHKQHPINQNHRTVQG
jgi:gamma-glutamylcyclotransferase (GGCT)/AIG2-like uncharacterized protein YtfP